MKILRLMPCLAFLLPSMVSGASCVGPSYENTVRQWGVVVNVFTSTTSSGQSFVAFYMRDWRPGETSTPTGSSVRVECGINAVALGCDQISVGDSVLLSGHLEEFAPCVTDPHNGLPLCYVSGPEDVTVPNLLYRCTDHLSGSCHQLTPCP